MLQLSKATAARPAQCSSRRKSAAAAAPLVSRRRRTAALAVAAAAGSSHHHHQLTAPPQHLRRHPRGTLTTARAAPDGEGEGEVYEVQESDDDVWATVALPVVMSSAEGQQVEYLVLDTDGSLAEPAVESYLQQLQGERDTEAKALQGAKDEASAARKAGGGGDDDWALDPTLLKRMAAVRDAERGLIVQVRGGEVVLVLGSVVVGFGVGMGLGLVGGGGVLVVLVLVVRLERMNASRNTHCSSPLLC